MLCFIVQPVEGRMNIKKKNKKIHIKNHQQTLFIIIKLKIKSIKNFPSNYNALFMK